MPQASDHLRDKRVEVILQQLDGAPALPAPARRALKLNESDGARLAELINVEPELARRTLKLLAAWGIDASSIEQAIDRARPGAARDAFLAVVIFQVFNSPQAGDSPFSRLEFWKHSIAVACCAELLAEQLRSTWGNDCDIEPAEAFFCGIVHDIGKVALDWVLPKSFARAVEATELLRGNIADAERTVIGVDHMVTGKRLAERWELSPTVRDCVWLHGQSPEAIPPTVRRPRLVNLITLADSIAREQRLGYSGNYTFHVARQVLIDVIGLTAQQCEEAASKLVEQIEPRASALGLGQASSTTLFTEAIAQANRELEQVAGQLESRNRRLAIRGKFFSDLSAFLGELKPDASAQHVIRAIGQTAVGFLDVTSCGVFSIQPDEDFAEVMLFDQAGEPFETTLVDCAKRPPRPETGEGPVLSAGRELEWLLSAISPRLAHEDRYWICLEADGVCVGGVVWGAMQGESTRLGAQTEELLAMAHGWALSLRTAQIREQARALAEQLAEANRRLQSAQAEVLQSRMMSSVGEMAAGAAHEMNNPLAVISGRSQLLSSQLTDPKHKAAAHLIQEQAHRLTDIITELMHFARPVPPKPMETDVAELIDRALHEAKMNNDPADRKIELTIGDVPGVIVDVEQTVAALVEVIKNALAATDPHKGQLSIHAAFDAYSLRVVLTVADNGAGMDDATMRRAFDPFFSSRPAGRRRGMGLPKAQRWVEASGGSIRLESRPDAGTRAIVLLPASKPLTGAGRTGRAVNE